MPEMKITHLFLFVFCFSFSLFSQNTENHHFPVTVLYGSKFMSQKFNSQFNSTGHFKFNGPVGMAGICLTGWHYNGLGNSLSHELDLYYAQVLPADISLNDTISGKTSGFQVGTTLYGYNLVSNKNKKNRVNFSLGFNTGRLKLSNSKSFKATNPFFSPKLVVKPGFGIGQFYLSFILEYEYDVSKSLWKAGKNPSLTQPEISKLRQSGFSAFINIGFFLKNSKKTAVGKTKPKNKKSPK